MLKLPERRKFANDIILECLGPSGFKHKRFPGNEAIAQFDQDIGGWLTIRHQVTGELSCSGLTVFYKDVSKIITEIGDAGRPSSKLSPKTMWERTAFRSDKEWGKKTSENRNLWISTGSTLASYRMFLDRYVEYLEKDGLAFVEKYSNPFVFLRELEEDQVVELKEEGLSWAQEGWFKYIKPNRTEGLFFGVILSKLCGDKGYDEKVEYARVRVEQLDLSRFKRMGDAAYKDPFMGYFERLLARLENEPPIYAEKYDDVVR